MEYAEYLELRLENRLVDPARWNLLPGGAAESFLAAQRLRHRFTRGASARGGLQPRLSFSGERGWEGGAALQRLTSGIERLDFYLFCQEPYFARLTATPVFRPGREILHFDFSALTLPTRKKSARKGSGKKKTGPLEKGAVSAQAWSGSTIPIGPTGSVDSPGPPGSHGSTDSSGAVPAAGPANAAAAVDRPPVLEAVFEASAAAVIPFGEELQEEVRLARRKYQGGRFGEPPLGLISLPPLGRSADLRLRLLFAPRSLRWVYAIRPKPERPLRLEGGPCAFRPRAEQGEEGGAQLLLESEAELSLALAPLPRMRLLLEGDDGRPVPLLDNLPLPGAAQVDWDRELDGYRALVRIDLSRFGLGF